ncbi:hypothetical protein AALO_G00223570 [Alosa alosa]|uniref:Uncharacterized protein n=1 Tax=Alosa alosa TaxID=278164 RepID=A0AAV6G0L6_9TELE|nr:hypothetical protein AALO_G00223570 [Alosa alosa]
MNFGRWSGFLVETAQRASEALEHLRHRCLIGHKEPSLFFRHRAVLEQVRWSDLREAHLFEVLEGELVHGVDLGQAGDDEVHDGAARSHRTVLLTCRVDHLLGGLRLLKT